MKKVLLVATAMFVAVLATVAIAPSASAYPELTCNLTVNAQTVTEGESFTATATAAAVESDARAAAEGDDISWVMTFHGETRTGNGATFSATFTAPDVEDTTDFTLTATATSPAGTCTRSVDITVLPSGTVVEPPGGGLPNAGGPRLAFLIVGAALVLAGTGAVVTARRRRTA